MPISSSMDRRKVLSAGLILGAGALIGGLSGCGSSTGVADIPLAAAT